MAAQIRPVVLITGATGRLGTLLRVAWQLEPPQGFSPLWSSRPQNARDGWLPWDIETDDCPPPGRRLDGILHLAGATPGRGQIGRIPMLAQTVCKAAVRLGVPLALASSAAVYGTGAGDFSEDGSLAPCSPYGQAKLEMEHIASGFRQGGARLTILRIGNIVGADALLTRTKATPICLDAVQGQPDGPERSWIGPMTLARVLSALLARMLAGLPVPDCLNVAQPGPIGMAVLLRAAAADWHFGPARPVAARVALDCRRLLSLPGVQLPVADASRLVAEWRRLGGVPA